MKQLKVPKRLKDWFDPYEVRVGGDGKVGIYTRDFNCRLATFNANTHVLQTRLRLFFQKCAEPEPKPKRKKRRPYVQRQPGDEDVFSVFQKDKR